MSSRRDRIRMTHDEVAAFLDAPRTVTVATLRADGRPHLTALWYVLTDGDVTFWTYAKSQKVVNLRRDPRVTCLVEAGDTYDQLRGVEIEGTAELLEDVDRVLDVGIAVLQRYGDAEADGAREQLREQARKRVAVRVRPDRVASWDHRKLGHTY